MIDADKIREAAISVGTRAREDALKVPGTSQRDAFAIGVKAYEAAMWRPIAKAPKDGTPLLAWNAFTWVYATRHYKKAWPLLLAGEEGFRNQPTSAPSPNRRSKRHETR